MIQGINLIGNKSKSLVRQKQAIHITQIIAVFCIIVVVGASVVIFFQKNIYANNLQKKQADTDASLAALTLLQPRLVKLSLVNDRFSQIQAVLAKRSSLDTNVAQILDQLPSNVTIQLLTIDKKHAVIGLTSSSLVGLDTFLNNLFDLSVNKKYFQDIKMSNLNVTNDKDKYSLSLELTLL